MSSVTPSLCVGGQLVASDRSKMKQAGITTIVNAAGDVAPASFSGEPWVSYLTMFLYDSPKQSIADQFPLLVKIVQETERHGGRMFVHCSQVSCALPPWRAHSTPQLWSPLHRRRLPRSLGLTRRHVCACAVVCAWHRA